MPDFKLADFNRDPIDLNDASVLVTGGTGSFGQRFVSTVLERYRPRRLAIYSRDELKQYEMAQIFPPSKYPGIRFFIGDVRDGERLEMAMRGIDLVVHAAALKHVPTAEYNPFECLHTNVLGAENVVRAAIRARVKKVIALSTDKAASPINLYGASKLASDKIFIAANNLSGTEMTRFSVVRYGNVAGSRGSVLPFFRKMIAEGADHLPVTDPRMTRFWITLQQGVDFVLSSLAAMRGGEIFVPKIPSCSIVDLARALAPKMPTKNVGIRPGEKLHELMITVDDARNTVELADRYVIEPAFAWWTRQSYRDVSKPVAEDFAYASNTNTQMLGVEDMREFLSQDPA
jgi:UDP-N-acetylglucosamine 4,6-dehydratase